MDLSDIFSFTFHPVGYSGIFKAGLMYKMLVSGESTEYLLQMSHFGEKQAKNTSVLQTFANINSIYDLILILNLNPTPKSKTTNPNPNPNSSPQKRGHT